MLVVHTYCTYFSLIFHPLRLQGPSPSFSTSLSPPSPFSREAVVELNRVRLPSRPQRPSSWIEVVKRSHRHPRPMLQSKKLTRFGCFFIKFLLTYLHVVGMMTVGYSSFAHVEVGRPDVWISVASGISDLSHAHIESYYVDHHPCHLDVFVCTVFVYFPTGCRLKEICYEWKTLASPDPPPACVLRGQ